MNIIPLFQGFEPPTENWSKLPHALIDALPQVTSLAEMKVILYILRHTWGYREFDVPKTITGDEFANGRKKSNGDRIDGGIGMSEPSVRTGIKNAIEHGFIVAEVDNSDMARIEKSYKLAMRVEEVGVNSLPSGDKEFTPRTKTINPRSEKDTLGKKTKKEKVVQPHPLIQKWIIIRGLDKIDIGAPVYTRFDTASAKRMAKWPTPPTDEEIQFCISVSPQRDKYAFEWLEKDIPKTRLARGANPTPVPPPPPPAEPVIELTPEQLAERQRQSDEIWAMLNDAIVEKAVA